MRVSGRLDGCIAVLAVLATGVVVHLLLDLVRVGVPTPSGLALLLAVLLVLGETRTVALGPVGGEVSVSATFALALAMVGPVWLLLPVQVLASLVDDVRRRKDLRKVVFNTAQLLLTSAAARAVYCLVAGRDYTADDAPLQLRDIGAGLVAAVVFFLVNSGSTAVVVALALEVPVRPYVVEQFRLQLATQGVLLSSAPAVVAAATFSPFVLALLLLPVLAVHHSAALAAERERRALHDDLTGLLNRPGFDAGVRDALARGPVTAVVLLDLDHFKDVNDSLGHDVGDRMLQEVGRRLAACLREGDSVARLGGDEFAVLAGGLAGPEEAAGLAARVLAQLGAPVELDGVRVHVGASCGLVVAPDDGDDAQVLLQRADVALYAAKQERGRVARYDAQQHGHSRARLALAADLRTALEDDSLCAWFQPQCDAVTGDVVGLEALARWRSPERGHVPPDVFVPVAESTGLIGALTEKVLGQALRQARRLADEGVPVAVAVNLSARCLTDLDLPDRVAAALALADVPAHRLVLEVTESVVMTDPVLSTRVLDALRALGVALSIDDFGTGYSSLSYLTRMRADEIKVDRSFVMAMATSHEDAVIVRSTVELGHGLGLRVVAEGVEDARTVDLLRELGCDLLQGYHLSRPLPPEDVLPWVRRHRLAGSVPAQPSPGGLPITAA